MALARGISHSLLPRRVIIGSDTRSSGPMLEAALVAGFTASGVDVLVLGVVPTPAVAAAVAASDSGTVGVMISASHNPYHDNGLKVFGADGRKLSDADQADVERAYLWSLDRIPGGPPPDPEPPDVGTVVSVPMPVEYLAGLGSSVDADLRRFHVVLDCANGATAPWAEQVFSAHCGRVDLVGADPDGHNINDGVGSTEPATVAAAVVDAGADLGLAFDGDGDRVIAVDHSGQVVNGDRILAVLATDWHRRGRLAGDTVVVTQMSNLGFLRAMEDAGITALVTAVGDRYVLDEMRKGSYTLGGEQSGHIICADLATTGDGMLAGLQLLCAIERSARPLADLAGGIMVEYPQVLKNLRLSEPHPDLLDRLGPQIAGAERRLGRDGRVLVRMSGTEPLLRVMVEHADERTAVEAADSLIAAARTLTR